MAKKIVSNINAEINNSLGQTRVANPSDFIQAQSNHNHRQRGEF